ncbi:hypothetical protein [Gordonia sp. MMO-8]|uniref:hypothetical protein n=1 Tax=Gordonia sp. MMO-8 TaxID=3127886 RepID=UPI003018FD95
MAWFKVDDGFHSSSKLIRIPRRIRLEAAGLWVIAGSWSASKELDGLVPDHMVDEWGGTPELVDALVSCGLWEQVDEGHVFVNWVLFQPTRAENEAKRKWERDRKAQARAAKRAKMSHRDKSGTPWDNDDSTSRPAVVPEKDAGTGAGVPVMSHWDSSGRPNSSHRDAENLQVGDVASGDCPTGTGVVVPFKSHPASEVVPSTRPDPTPINRGSETGDVTSGTSQVSPTNPFRCARHQTTVNPPSCGACAAARTEAQHAKSLRDAEAVRVLEQAQADEQAARESELADRQLTIEAAISDIDACQMCNDRGYRGSRVCSHDPEEDTRRATGLAKVRAELAKKNGQDQ